MVRRRRGLGGDKQNRQPMQGSPDWTSETWTKPSSVQVDYGESTLRTEFENEFRPEPRPDPWFASHAFGIHPDAKLQALLQQFLPIAFSLSALTMEAGAGDAAPAIPVPAPIDLDP